MPGKRHPSPGSLPDEGGDTASFRISAARLRALGDNIPGGALYQLMMTPDGRRCFTHASAGFERIFGMTPERILADPEGLHAMIVEEDRARLYAEEDRCAASMEVFDAEFRQRTVGGEVKWIHARSTPRRLDDGSILWDGVATDITRRKQADFERETMTRLLDLLNRPGDLLELIRSVTALIRESFDCEADIRLSDGPETGRQALARESEGLFLLRSGGIIYGLLQVTDPRTGRFSPESLSLLERLSDSLAIGLAHRQAAAGREALARQRQLALDAAHLGWWRYDPNSGVATWDEGYRRIFGVSGFARLTDEILSQLIHPDDQSELRARVAAALDPADPKPFASTYRIIRPDGQTRWVEAHGTVTFDGEGAARKAADFVGTVEDITERRNASDALHASEERFWTLVGSIPGMVYRARPDWTVEITFGSEPICGYTSGQLEHGGINWQSLIHPDDRARVLAESSGMRQAKLLDQDYRIVTRDGSIRWVHDRKTLRFTEEGAPAGADGFVFDNTDRKRAEEARLESEARYRLLFESARDGMAMADMGTGRIVDCNAALCRLLGRGKSEIVGQTHAVLHPPDELMQGKSPSYRRHQDLPVGLSVEDRLLAKDGRIISVEVKSNARINMGGQDYQLVVFFDLTERNRAESERTRLVAAIEPAAETVVITDVQGSILYCNPAFERISGYSRQEALGKNPRILKGGREDAAFYRRMWDTLTRGEVWSGRFLNKRKDGSFYEEEATISPVRDAGGTIVNYVAVKRDITREQELKAQLLHSQKMEAIGTLAGGVAHEINNPLMGIQGYAELIVEQAVHSPEIAAYAGQIHMLTDRVATIVRNLLSFARHDKQVHSPEPMSGIVGAVLSLTEAVMRHDQVLLDVDVPEDQPPIRCRSQQIQQVVMNLLTNARDALNDKYPASHPDKIVRIRARVLPGPAARVRLTVEDHGPGIPDAVIKRIFDPFFTTKPKDKGTGLGLSISHGIIRDHGGELSVETKAGEWTRFHVDLPLAGGSRRP